MGRIKDYPTKTALSDADVLLVDGSEGTKIITKKAFKEDLCNVETYDVSGTNLSSTIKVLKRAGLAQIIYNNGITKLSANEWTTICTLPDAYRPVNVFSTCVTNNPKVIRIAVDTDGTVKAFNYGAAITATENFAFSATYMTNKI